MRPRVRRNPSSSGCTPADVRKTLADGLGMDLVVSTPEELQKWTLEQLARWGKVVKDNNIKTD